MYYEMEKMKAHNGLVHIMRVHKENPKIRRTPRKNYKRIE